MTILPLVRYMLLCEDWSVDPANPLRISIAGLISNIKSVGDPAYLLLYRELCVFLALTEGRGQGEGHTVCVFEDAGQKIFETAKRPIQFGSDPLEVVGVPFRIRDCVFPFPGVYAIQFWYDGKKLDERPLRLR